MIEFRHLTALKALEQTDSVSLAADKLYLSQSALSHQLKELEQRLGHPLFIRKTKPIQFTRQGQLILELADKILPEIEMTKALLDPRNSYLQPPKVLELALECHSCYLWLLPVLKAFHQQWPDIQTELRSEYPFDPLEALADKQLHWVLTADPQSLPSVQYAPLFHYETVLVTAKNHPFAAKPFVTAQELKTTQLITYPVAPQKLDLFQEFLQPAGITPKQVRHSRHPLMMLQQVSQSEEIAALPRWVVSELGTALDLNTVRLGEHGLWRTMYLACDQQSTPWTTSFIDLARKMALIYPGIKEIALK